MNTSYHDLQWFSTYYYPSMRFIITIPEFKNLILSNIVVRTKLNISLEVNFHDKEGFKRTFAFSEKAKQTGFQMIIKEEENKKGVNQEFYLSFRC